MLLLETTGLDDMLARSGTEEVFTLFAPTDTAFGAMNFTLFWNLLGDKAGLIDVLLFHIVSDAEMLSTHLVCSESIEMANNQTSTTVCQGDSIFQRGEGNIDDEQMPLIVESDIGACNGVVHVVDNVLLP